MQMGYWDGNRFVIPGLPQATPPSVTQPPQGIIPQANMVQSPVQQFQQRPSPPNMMGRGEDSGSDAPQPTNPYSGGLNYGQNLGAIGLVSGIPGAGPLGAAIGTAIDTRQANETLGQFVGSKPHEQVSYLEGLLNNATFGWLGESTAGQAMDNIESHPDVQRQAAAEAQIALDAFGGGGDQQYGNTGTGAPSPEPGGAYGYDPDGGVSQTDAPSSEPGGAYGYDPDGGVSQGSNDTVICTELHRQGYETDEFMALDRKYGIRQPEDVMAGYHAWAKPLVRLMQRSRVVTQIVRFVSAPVRKAIAYQMGGNVWPPVTGIIMLKTGTWICRQISAVSKVIKLMTSGRTSPT